MTLVPARQTGAATLIGAVFLFAVVALVVAFAALMAGSDVRDSELLDENVEALLIAESGLENATGRLIAGTPCANLALTRNLGRGSFAIAAGQTTDFSGAALPAGHCRVQVTGLVPLGGAARTIEGIVITNPVIGFDNTVSTASTNNNSNALNWGHTVGAGTNRLLVVALSLRHTGAQAATAVTYNGINLTPFIIQTNNNNARVELWYLTNPPTGTANVAIAWSGASTRAVGGAMSFSGVDQTTPLEDPEGATGNSTAGSAVSVTVTTTVRGAWVIDAVASRTGLTMTTAGGRTQRWNIQTGGGNLRRAVGAASTRGPIALPAAITMNWTANGGGTPAWAIVGAGVRPIGSLLSWREVPVP